MTARPTCVLFAAGRGERLRPLTEGVPKPCLPLLDIPLAAWGLEALMSLGAEPLVNASFRATQVVAGLEPHAGNARFVIETPHPYGTAGTLVALREGLGERVLTWNSDELTDLDPSDLLATHRRLGAPATLAVVPVTAGADLELSGDAAAAFVDRRARPGAPGAGYIGVAVFDRAVLDLLPHTRPLGLAEALIRPLVARGDVAVYRHNGYALDVGTPERYLEASSDLLAGTGPPPPVPHPGTVGETAGGRCYLGPGARAAPETLGPGAILLAGARVHPGARVAHAVVWEGEVVPSGAVVDGTVWANGGPLTGLGPLGGEALRESSAPPAR